MGWPLEAVTSQEAMRPSAPTLTDIDTLPSSLFLTEEDG